MKNSIKQMNQIEEEILSGITMIDQNFDELATEYSERVNHAYKTMYGKDYDENSKIVLLESLKLNIDLPEKVKTLNMKAESDFILYDWFAVEGGFIRNIEFNCVSYVVMHYTEEHRVKIIEHSSDSVNFYKMLKWVVNYSDYDNRLDFENGLDAEQRLYDYIDAEIKKTMIEGVLVMGETINYCREFPRQYLITVNGKQQIRSIYFDKEDNQWELVY